MIIPRREQLEAAIGSSAVGSIIDAVSGVTGLCLAVLDSGGSTMHCSPSETVPCKPADGLTLRESLPCPPDSCPAGLKAVRLPLEHQGDTVGWLHLCGPTPDDRPDRHGQTIQSLVIDALNHQYEMDNLSSEILEKYEELNVLYDVGDSLHINMNREEICRLMLDKVQQVVGADRIGVLLCSGADRTLQMVADSGYDPDFAGCRTHREILVLAGHVAESGKALLLDSRESCPPDLLERLIRNSHARSEPWPILAAPIKRGQQMLGVLHTTHKVDNQTFTANDLKLVMAICSQAAVAISNLQMVEELKKTEALKREMDIARNIQMKMLPSKPLDIGTVSVAGRCTTAANVGGDYYDHICITEGPGADPDLTHLLIADVSGHDLGAALMMSVGRKVFHTAVRRELGPAELMREFNTVMHDDLSGSDLFITMFYAQYRHSDRTLRFSNAGHNPPFIIRGADGTVEELDADGIIVGVLEDMVFETGETTLQAGDLAIFYTDGVTETENPDEEQYGLERFHALVRENRTASPSDLLDTIYHSVADYSGGAAQYDDITVLLLKDNG